MASALLLLAQSVSEAPAEPAKPDAQCEAADGEIVVCGSRKANDRYRLKPLPPAREGPNKAEVSLGGGATLSAETEAGGVPGAESVPRVMVRFKLKF